MRISVFLGHEPVAVLRTMKMFIIVHTGKKCNTRCLTGDVSKPLHGITDNKL